MEKITLPSCLVGDIVLLPLSAKDYRKDISEKVS